MDLLREAVSQDEHRALCRRIRELESANAQLELERNASRREAKTLREQLAAREALAEGRAQEIGVNVEQLRRKIRGYDASQARGNCDSDDAKIARALLARIEAEAFSP
jgi:predicted  nucleic acid-binding Zn-ribbon protein